MSRPSKPIDWDLVDELLLAGCHGTEIAPHFDLHVNTFYDRVQDEKNMGFTEYSLQKKQQGDACLRKVQYDKALTGDNTMLVWLGKQRLGQREHKEDTQQNKEFTLKVQYPNAPDNRIEILSPIVSNTDTASAE